MRHLKFGLLAGAALFALASTAAADDLTRTFSGVKSGSVVYEGTPHDVPTDANGQINGIVNFEFWAPEVADKFPFMNDFLKKYQERAAKEGVDLLGFYLPPYAYAMMQVYEQAIKSVGSLDQGKLAEHIHKAEFDTVVGKMRFAKNGEWDRARVMLVQYHSINGNDLDQWRKPGRINILYPNEFKTGTLKAPFHENRK